MASSSATVPTNVSESEELIVADFKKERLLGQGSSSSVYLATNTFSNDVAALKVEKAEKNQLNQEAYVLYKLQNAIGVPLIYYYQGKHLIMELLGPSIEHLYRVNCEGQFSLKTVLMLAIQMFDRVEYLHSKGFIYRDIKPENFLMGTGVNSHLVYLIDYGLAKPYLERHSKIHIPLRTRSGVVGTVRYASLNAQKMLEISRRDDLEALGYLFVYLAKGDLPWQHTGDSRTRKTKVQLIGNEKDAISLEDLCKGLPNEFLEFIKYSRELDFEQTPDYAHLRQLFTDLFQKMNYVLDYEYDWIIRQKSQTNIDTENPGTSYTGTSSCLATPSFRTSTGTSSIKNSSATSIPRTSSENTNIGTSEETSNFLKVSPSSTKVSPEEKRRRQI